MTDFVEIRVHGTPGAQGSKRHVGGGRMIESSKKVAPWREAVKWAVLRSGAKRMDGPIASEIVFTWPKPKSAPKRRVTYPDRTPDLDKLLRSTFDALTQSGLIEDDARIVSCISRKVFPGEDADALDTPGAVIRLARML